MTNSLASSRSRLGSVALVGTAMLLCGIAVAQPQSPYPTATTPDPGWGGYNVAQAVPYQPTLTAPAAPVVITSTPPPGQAYTLANPIPLPSQPPTIVAPNAGQVWQPFPPGIEAPIGATPNVPLTSP